MAVSTNLRWRYQQYTKSGGLWTSDEVFEGDYRRAVQGVIAGALLGEPRAAIEEGTGRVIYALDERCMATAAAVRMFNTLDLLEDAARQPSAHAPDLQGRPRGSKPGAGR